MFVHEKKINSYQAAIGTLVSAMNNEGYSLVTMCSVPNDGTCVLMVFTKVKAH